MTATQPVTTVWSWLVFCLQLPDNLTMEDLELQKEFCPLELLADKRVGFFPGEHVMVWPFPCRLQDRLP